MKNKGLYQEAVGFNHIIDLNFMNLHTQFANFSPSSTTRLVSLQGVQWVPVSSHPVLKYHKAERRTKQQLICTLLHLNDIFRQTEAPVASCDFF